MTGLVEFLVARIAEDEAVAREMRDDDEAWGNPYSSGASSRFEGQFNAERVLAECDAKRRIVADYESAEACALDDEHDPDSQLLCAWRGQGLFDALHDLAAIYADHPDYDETWRT